MVKNHKKYKIIDDMECKIIGCKKYDNILDCPKDFLDCIKCESQSIRLKWKNRHIRKSIKKEKKYEKNCI